MTVPTPPAMATPKSYDWDKMIRLRALAMSEPQTEEELHLWFKVVLGVHFPRVAISGIPGGCAPFDPVRDLCLDRVEDALIMGPRDGWKTLGLACTLLYKCLFRPRIECVSFGAVDYQAQKCYQYVRDFLNRTGFSLGLNLDSGDPAEIGIFGSLTDGPIVLCSHLKETRFTNGATLKIFPGTVNAVNSQHPQFTAADEVESWPWNVLEDFKGMASSGATNYTPQRVLMSVRRTSTGTMAKLLKRREEMGLKFYTWSILDVLEKCPECIGAKCELWEDCRGAALHADGAKPLREVIRTKRQTDPNTWHAQHMCRKPGGHGLVYESFDETIHVAKDDPSLAEYHEEWGPIYLGIDFGHAHPYCVVFTQWHDGQLSVFDLLSVTRHDTSQVKRLIMLGAWPTDPDTLDHSNYYRQFLKFEEHPKTKQLLCTNVDLGFYDPSRPQEGEEWLRARDLDGVRIAGFRCYQPDQKPIMDGVAGVRRLLRVEGGRPGLIIHPRCKRLIWEMGEAYVLAVDNRVGEVVEDKTIPKNDDASSALRYLVVGLILSRVGIH